MYGAYRGEITSQTHTWCTGIFISYSISVSPKGRALLRAWMRVQINLVYLKGERLGRMKE